jgi:hypothetical protein
MKSSIFWDITLYSSAKVIRRFGGTSPPSSGLKIKPNNKPAWSRKQAALLKLEATGSSETSVDFHQTTRRYIPQARTLHNYRCENLKSYIIQIIKFLNM